MEQKLSESVNGSNSNGIGDAWFDAERNSKRNARKAFSRIGISLTLIALVTFAVQIIVQIALELIGYADWSESTEGLFILSFVPLYCIAVPIGLLVMKKTPSVYLKKAKLGAKNYLVFFLMCIPLTYIGNLVGIMISGIASGGSASNALNEYVSDVSIFQVLVMVVLAPIIEEFIFRKQLIDRTVRYGEGTAILLSGLTFALFHTNMFQFFYAFALGLLFAYIYVRTGRLRYVISLHMIINFMGSIVSSLVLSLAEKGEFGMFISGMYSLLVLGLIIWGMVLLIKRRKRFKCFPAECELPKKQVFQIAYLNVGMIIFILFFLAATVLSVVS
ncbi:MAG: CPBP family intramembrane metalloprotease [Christensenellaceae bacterium]|nr:CPBP family intramembrane metalloprotease [Christensenellaceae bacterium]